MATQYQFTYENSLALLKVAKYALADLEGIMPEFEPSGDRTNPAWQTILDLREAIQAAEAGGR